MFTLSTNAAGLSRRDFLRTSSLGLAGLGMGGILRARAEEAMAESDVQITEASAQADHERSESYVVLQLGTESYALEVTRVREVLDVAALTRVPGGLRALMGLYNLRGHVVPVWNLRIPFHLNDDISQERAPSVLMVEPDAAQPSRVAGLLVDRVSDVLDFAPGDIQPAPTLGLGGGSKFVRGLIRYQERFLLVLDLDRVFSALLEDPTNGAP